MRPEDVPDHLVEQAKAAILARAYEPGPFEPARVALAAVLDEFAKYVLLDAAYAIDGLEYIGDFPEDPANPEATEAYAEYANRTSTSEWLRNYAEKTYL